MMKILRRFVSLLVIASMINMLIISPVLACLNGLMMSAGTVTLESPSGTVTGPTTISLSQTYTNPVIFLLPDNANGDPSTVRLLSSTGSSFTVGTSEAESEDGSTTDTNFNYLVVEAGNYTLGGQEFQAGTFSLTQAVGPGGAGAFSTQSFSTALTSAPIVIGELQSFANDPTYDFTTTAITSPWMEVTVDQTAATASTTDIAIERAETSAGTITSNETIAYLAVEPGAGSFLDGATTVNFNAFTTADNITDACITNNHSLSGSTVMAIATMGRRDGDNGGWILQCSVSATTIGLKVQEDQAQDAELGHTTETANVFAFDRSFSVDLTGSGGPVMEGGSATVNGQNIPTNLNEVTETFPQAFSETPMVFVLPRDADSDPASVRISNVDVNGFDIVQVEPQGSAGSSNADTIDYIAIVPQTITLPDGTTVIEAGSIPTTAFEGRNVSGTGTSTIALTGTYTANPSLLLQVQTMNSDAAFNPINVSSPWLEAIATARSTVNQTVTMDRGETSNGTVVSETMGYVAMVAGTDITFSADSSKSIRLKAFDTSNNIDGFVENCNTTTYPGVAFSAEPLTVASAVTRNGADGLWVRRCSHSAATIGLAADEDNVDGERNHALETASVLSVSETFEWCSPVLNVQKSSNVERDPVNGVTDPKAIPNSLQRYTIDLRNESVVDIESGLAIVDQIPANTSLFVQSSASYPESPLLFDANGSTGVASGVTVTYSGHLSTTDNVEFSIDGTDFGYDPMPDGDGFDSNITHIRIIPTGIFDGMNNASSVPNFTVGFAVRID